MIGVVKFVFERAVPDVDNIILFEKKCRPSCTLEFVRVAERRIGLNTVCRCISPGTVM